VTVRPDRRASRFPDPATAPADGPLALGGDLAPETLVEAYALGIFPWPDGRGRLSWWSPDPRAVFPIGGVHVSRSLARTLRSGRFRCTVDTAFAQVVAACAHRPGEGTWIVPAMESAYRRLHAMGLAASLEVWEEDRLVGGIYGVVLGSAFMGESMFHRVPDASKVALVHLDRRLAAGGFTLFDAQLPTPHLLRMGAEVVPRRRYLAALAGAVAAPARSLRAD
jgi:leucyl/phenylalanyl-tRNA---protein transferase